MILVDSDLIVPAELTQIRAIIRDDLDSAVSEHSFALPQVSLPFSFGVNHTGGALGVTIELQAIGPESPTPRLIRRAVTSFIEGKTLLLPMFLAKQCIGTSCGLGLTCTERGCQSEVVDSTTLQEIDPGAESSYDAGRPPPPDDGGTPIEDGSVDRGTILVDPTTGLITSESGQTASFTVRLDRAPTSYVAIAVSSSDPAEGLPDVSLLTFTPVDWDMPKTVRAIGNDDRRDDGDRPYSIILAAAIGDPAFEAFDPPDVEVINVDDDAVAIRTIGAAGLSTTERGDPATFSVVLGTEPALDVILRLESSDLSEGFVTTTTITFTPADWDVAREVTAFGADDTELDGVQRYEVRLDPSTSPDPDYAALPLVKVEIANSDDETPGITVTPAAGLETTETGDTAQFSVVLNTAPTAGVSIALMSGNLSEGTVWPELLVFDALNWSAPQLVTVTGADDAIDDDDASYSILTAPAISVDPRYHMLDAPDVQALNRDDDTAGVTIDPINGLVTAEPSGTTSFSVVLDSEPTANVRISFSSSDPGEGDVSPAILDFTSSNWSVHQTVVITAADDAIADGITAYRIVSAAAASSDLKYAGLDPPDISVMNADDDSPGITVAPTSITTTEGGGSATFSVRLTTEPSAAVSINLSASDAGEARISPSALTFGTGDWSIEQEVTVTGVQDMIDDGDVITTIVTAPATSADPDYAGIDPADVSVTNTDDDIAQISITPLSGLVTSEAGGTAMFTISLSTEPSANVTIGLGSSDVTEGTISASSVTLTSFNWSTGVTVTITGVADEIDDGNISYAINTAPATSADPSYNGHNPANVSVVNTDDDTANIVITPASGLVAFESGQTASFAVRLESRPAANVTVLLSTMWGGELMLSPPEASFTPATWNVERTVVVTTGDDNALDGDRNLTIVTSVASTDPLYAAINPADVAVRTIDDGTLPPVDLTIGMGGGTTFDSRSPSISTDGRMIAFDTDRNDLAPGDTNGRRDVYVFNRGQLSWTLVSRSTTGVLGNGESSFGVISDDGRWVVFQSDANNLVDDDSNALTDVFLHDLQTGTTTLISDPDTSSGSELAAAATRPGISADGSFISFDCTHPFDPSAPGTRGWTYQRSTGLITPSGQSTLALLKFVLSADGRYVLFQKNLDGAGNRDVVQFDRLGSSQMLVGLESVDMSDPDMTPDGRFLVFTSFDDPTIIGDDNGANDVILYDRTSMLGELISHAGNGGFEGNADSDDASVSDDGRYVTFASLANNVVTGIPSGWFYLRDRVAATTTPIAESDNQFPPRISGNGRFITYLSPGPPRSVFLISRP